MFDNADLLQQGKWILPLHCCAGAEPQRTEPHVLRLEFSCTIWGDAWIYFWSSDFPRAQQLHLLCAIQYKSNRVRGTVQLRDYGDYVIVLFGKYSRVNLKPFDKGALAAAMQRCSARRT